MEELAAGIYFTPGVIGFCRKYFEICAAPAMISDYLPDDLLGPVSRASCCSLRMRTPVTTCLLYVRMSMWLSRPSVVGVTLLRRY